jgi:hypothetical protein
MDTLDEDLWGCKIISWWVLLRMRNVSDKSCRENKTTQFMYQNSPPPQNSCLWYSVGKYCGARHAMDDKIIHCRKDVISMPDN